VPAAAGARFVADPQARYVLHCDGASRGNPGRAAIGYVLYDAEQREVLARGEALPVETTNNVAEYESLLRGLAAAAEAGVRRVVVRMDSELVVRQTLGVYKVRHPRLQPLFEAVRTRARAFAAFGIEHVPRHANQRADELANQALDAALPGGTPTC
jgi:probable phosphoglycerate mutase